MPQVWQWFLLWFWIVELTIVSNIFIASKSLSTWNFMNEGFLTSPKRPSCYFWVKTHSKHTKIKTTQKSDVLCGLNRPPEQQLAFFHPRSHAQKGNASSSKAQFLVLTSLQTHCFVPLQLLSHHIPPLYYNDQLLKSIIALWERIKIPKLVPYIL